MKKTVRVDRGGCYRNASENIYYVKRGNVKSLENWHWHKYDHIGLRIVLKEKKCLLK